MTSASHSEWFPKPRAATSGLLQRHCACGTRTQGSDCESCKEKRLLQRAAINAEGPDYAPSIVHDVLRSPGKPVEENVLVQMEGLFGRDFSRVRLHTDERAGISADAVQAKAYTVGQHIAFGPNNFQPNTAAGRELLVHEFVHVVQQGDQDQSAPMSLRISRPTEREEKDATLAGRDLRTINEWPPKSFSLGRVARHGERRLYRQIITSEGNCQETNHGTSLEHQAIQGHYKIKISPSALREYSVPLAGRSGKRAGYIDILDGHDIYEIKRADESTAKVNEQVLRYLRLISEYCDPLAGLGSSYPSPQVVPFSNDIDLIVSQLRPGILVYSRRAKKPDATERPLPIPIMKDIPKDVKAANDNAASEPSVAVQQKTRDMFPAWLIHVMVVAGILGLVVGCVASGVCAAAAIVEGLGAVAGAVVLAILRRFGVREKTTETEMPETMS